MHKHMEKLNYRCYASVDMDAIDYNLAQIQGIMAPGVKTMVVIKADGYGHGAIPVAKHLEGKVDYFAVACTYEAQELRAAGIKAPILVLSYTTPACYKDLLDGDLTACIYNLDEARLLSAAALESGKQVKVHAAVDTGMGRVGVEPTEEGADIIAAIAALPGIEMEGLFSHYACADTADKRDRDAQTHLFDEFISMLEQRGVEIPIKHICNSAGTMESDKQYDMCRVGIAMYGLYPSEEMDKSKIDLRPAMEVVGHVIHVKTVPAGYKIGYGHIYTTPSEKKIATVSIGYADGYNRCMTGVGYVLIRGKKAPVVGKVCMDQMMVDVTDIADVAVEDIAVILGKSGDLEISAETLGEMCYSFSYEVVCTFTSRVKRVYYLNGERIDL